MTDSQSVGILPELGVIMDHNNYMSMLRKKLRSIAPDGAATGGKHIDSDRAVDMPSSFVADIAPIVYETHGWTTLYPRSYMTAKRRYIEDLMAANPGGTARLIDDLLAAPRPSEGPAQ